MLQTDPFFQITEYELPLPCLDRDITILQMSDLHLAVAEETSSAEWKQQAEKCRENWKRGRLDFAAMFGDSCDPVHLAEPEAILEKFIDLANCLRPDALLMSGDMQDLFHEETLRFLENALSRLQVPWMFVRGNHDDGAAEIYDPLTQNGAAVQQLQLGKLTLLGIHNGEKRVTAAQLQALRHTAQTAAAEGQCPVLAMHIPVVTPCNQTQTACFDPYFLLGAGEADADSQAFLQWLQSADCPIHALLCGHVHGSHRSCFAPGKPQICCSSALVGAGAIIRFVPET